MRSNKMKVTVWIMLIFIIISFFIGTGQNIMAADSTAIDYIKNNWLNYTNNTGKWHVSTVNGYPAIGSTYNADAWTGYLNDSRAGQTTIDAEFDFYMIQNEPSGHWIDDDNMGWTFRHTYNGSYSNINNHSFYAFVTRGSANGWQYETGLYKRTGSTFTKIASFDFYRSKGVAYHVKINVKDESNGTRIKIYINNNLVVNYLDTNPLPMGGYGPFSKSQAYAYFYNIKVNGASFLNIPPTISVSSPANGGVYRHGDKITISGNMYDEDARGTLSAYYSIDGGTEQLINTVNSNGKPQNFNTTYTIPSSLPDGTHTIRIVVKDNEKGQSEIVSRTFSVYTKPTQPLSKGYDNITANSVRLLWNTNGNPSTMGYHYEVRRKSDNSLVSQGTVNGSSVTIGGLTGGHENYRFYVRAINGNNEVTDFTELWIPSLQVYQKSNYAKAEWAVEMVDSDVLTMTSFENGQERPTLGWAGTNGGQSFTTETAYEGQYSVRIEDTYANGNHYNFPATSSNKSIMGFGRKYFPNGMDLSISFNAKSTGSGSFTPFGDGGWAETLLYRDNKVAVTAPKGSTKIKLDTLSGIYLGGYITTDTTDSPVRNMYQIRDIDTANNTITLHTGLASQLNVGEKLRYRNWRGAFTFSSRTVNSNQWTLFNINTKVNDYDDYDVLKRGGTFYINTWTEDVVYLDNLKFGYATKTQLYRDGTKLYEGFLSDYDDYAAVDKAKPDGISKIDVSNTGNTINITFDKPKDYGTTYNYQVKALNHQGETINSEVKSVTIISDIKGYSYVIDSNPNTIPDNVVDVTTPSIKKAINPNVKNYVHIKVIDNQGNVASQVFHKEINVPVLTATPVPEEDYIHLDWQMNDTSRKYSYMIFKKAEGEREFQSIPAKDRIKVLNIYPGVGNNLKTWMETNGYGKGKISVDEVHIDEFNSNPSSYLKDGNGNWKYDVIYMGAWDTNNQKNLNDNAVNLVSEFIDSGRGFLAGHDTIGYNYGTTTGLSKLRDKFNIKVGYWSNPNAPTDEGFHYFGGYSNTKIIVKKKGLLTNYPWKIGDINTELSVPSTHSTSNFAFGDIWMVFPEDNKWSGSNFPSELNESSNFYLTTWNNTAMIQTGHSNGKATADEQKLIANTLFYLGQITDKTSWDDHSGQDVTGPTKPIITDTRMINNGNTIHIEYTGSQDRGTKYYYYVEASAANTNVTSNIAEATITSGLQGYSIVVDQNPNTIPDNKIETTELSFDINQKFYQKFYVHVAAVDKVGNISEVAHFECADTIAPTLTVTGNPTVWTNQDIVLTAKATDNESGIKGIKLPNNQWVYGDTATFTVKENGNYVFVAEDNFGNQTTVTVQVTKIDKIPPMDTSIIINNNDLYTNHRDVSLTIKANDNATGVSQMRFKTENSPWSAWVPYATSYNYTMDAGFTHQGTNRVYVQFKDGVGNIGGDASDSIIFDNIAPTGEINFGKNTVTTRNIHFTVNAYDINPSSADMISGLNSVRFRELQDGVVKQNWTSWEQHNFTRNWILSDGDGAKVIEMEIRDNAGNIGKVSKTIVLDTLFIKNALFTDIVNPPLGNPELPTSEVVKVKKGYEFTFIVKTTGEPDKATYTFNGEAGTMTKITDNLFTQTLKVDINDETVDNEVLPINITVSRNDGTKKSTTLKVHIEGSAYDDYNINLTN